MFDKPGVVRVFCDIHSHMSAFVLVFNHPYFATTDAEGRYRIDNPARHLLGGRLARGRRARDRGVTIPPGRRRRPRLRRPMMRVASLTNRIFLACTMLATLSLGFAFYYVNARATGEAESVAASGDWPMPRPSSSNSAARRSQHVHQVGARSSPISPKLKAPCPPAIRRQCSRSPTTTSRRDDADLFVVLGPPARARRRRADGAGHQSGRSAPPDPIDDCRCVIAARARPAAGDQRADLRHGRAARPVLGRLTVGFFLDDDLAVQFRRVTGSEIAFGAEGRILASSLPTERNTPAGRVLSANGIPT